MTSSLTRFPPCAHVSIGPERRPRREGPHVAGTPPARGSCTRADDAGSDGVTVLPRPMAFHPGIGAPVLDRLGPRDVPEVLSFLEDDPVLHVYLIALVLRDALARPH